MPPAPRGPTTSYGPRREPAGTSSNPLIEGARMTPPLCPYADRTCGGVEAFYGNALGLHLLCIAQRDVAQDLLLEGDELLDALVGGGHQRRQLGVAKGRALGRALDLDEQPGPGLHDVHVDLGLGVLVVVEVQQ